MTHGRRYGERPVHPIYLSNGILEPKHVKNIGPAIFVFLWLIDRTTRQVDGAGIVLGGKPVKAFEVGESLGICQKTFLRSLDRLVRHGYVERTLAPNGYIVRVLKDYKYARQVAQNCPTSQGRDRAKVSDPTDKTVRPGRTQLSDARRESSDESVEQAAPACELWTLLGMDPCKTRPSFKEHCEQRFAARDGQPIGDFVAECMDSWELLGNRIPAPFAQAVNAFRERERATRVASPITYLPEVPFKTKEEPCQTKS